MKKIIRFIFMFLLCLNLNVSSSKKDYSNYVTNDTVSIISQNTYNYLLSKNINKVYQNGYYAPYYFKNLVNNFPVNSHDSCNYTAIAMLLSFYDTYWNDYIIPEQYEVNTNLSTSTHVHNIYSPGLVYESEDISNLSDSTYSSYIMSEYNNDFQALLIKIARDYGIVTNSSLGLDFNQVRNLLDCYLNVTNICPTNMFNIVTNSQAGYSPIGFIQTFVRMGYPVLLRLGGGSTNGHTVIAHDYDSSTGEIYVHTGWKRYEMALSHIPLSELFYTEYYDAIAIVPSSSHSHSNNYYVNNTTYCPCQFMYSFNNFNIQSSTNYMDKLPKYTWDSTCKERWISQNDFNYEIDIIKISSNGIEENISTYNTKNNYFTIDRPADWKELLENDGNYKINVKFNYIGNSALYNDFSINKTFSKPSSLKDNPYLTPSISNAPVNITGTAFNNYTINNNDFSVSYYRTIYDSTNDVLTMSSINSTHKSFMIFDFEKNVTRMDVELGLYTEAIPFMTSGNYRIYIAEYTDEDNDGDEELIKIVDIIGGDSPLFSQINGRENNLEELTVYFDHPVKKIAFTLQYIGDANDVNKIEHLAVGEMKFYNEDSNGILPLSGYELDYNPDYWNGEDVKDYNCYAYALNTKNHGYMQPGQSTLISITRFEIININKLLSKINSDSKNYGFIFTPINKYEICPIGTYKVALVVDNENESESLLYPDYDYHWYRQNSDGYWSHKPGGGNVINTPHIYPDSDAIKDPETCSRYVNYLYNYNYFVGFYAVTPLN